MTRIINAIGFGKTARKLVLAVAGVAGLAGFAPGTAQARGHTDVDIDLRFTNILPGEPRYQPAEYEDRQTRVWVPGETRTESSRVWVQPVYRTVCDRVWHEPVTQMQWQRVWVPDCYETRRVEHYQRGRRVISDEQVLVAPAHWENQQVAVQVSPGWYEDVQRQELVCDGHWDIVNRQVEVCPGHWEVRTERVVHPGHWDQRPILDVHLPLFRH